MNWLREGGLLKPERLSENSVLGNEIKDTFVSGCERKGLRIIYLQQKNGDVLPLNEFGI